MDIDSFIDKLRTSPDEENTKKILSENSETAKTFPLTLFMSIVRTGNIEKLNIFVEEVLDFDMSSVKDSKNRTYLEWLESRYPSYRLPRIQNSFDDSELRGQSVEQFCDTYVKSLLFLISNGYIEEQPDCKGYVEELNELYHQFNTSVDGDSFFGFGKNIKG